MAAPPSIEVSATDDAQSSLARTPSRSGRGKGKRRRLLTSGFLSKRGHFRKNWKRRFFLLNDTLLYYFDKRPADMSNVNFDKNSKGAIELDGCFVTHTLKHVFKKDFCFNVQTKEGKDYYITADSEELREAWMETIRHVREHGPPDYAIQGGDASRPRSVTQRMTPIDLEQADTEGSVASLQQVERPNVTLKDFELLKVIGKGSFAKVMQARKRDNGRIYAIKVLSKGKLSKSKQVEHTIAEKEILTQLNHPFLLMLHYAFQSADSLYLVLDFINGGELFYHQQLEGRFDLERTRLYTAEITLALGHLHSLGFIYRDLKPENLLLNADGHIKVADFGLVKALGSPNDITYTFCGTPEYLAPEILMHTGHGRAVDWWCLGVLVYEMLTGRPPFRGKSANDIYKKILSTRLAFPNTVAGSAKEFISDLLERDPARRLGAAEDGVEDIKAHAFFDGMDWDRVLALEYEPPFVPDVTGPEDISMIDPMFTQTKIGSAERVFTQRLLNDDAFDNFSFNGSQGSVGVPEAVYDPEDGSGDDSGDSDDDGDVGTSTATPGGSGSDGPSSPRVARTASTNGRLQMLT